MNEEDITQKMIVRDDNKWEEEDQITLETIQKAHLKIARIIFSKENPPKRCIAFSKNRKSVAFDIEMVPVIINYLVKMTPEAFIPKEFWTPELREVWKALSK